MMVVAKRPFVGSLKEEDHFGHRRQVEERAQRQQEADEAESTDREKVGIKRLIADMIYPHLAADLCASD
jgi:hypothetical protein